MTNPICGQTVALTRCSAEHQLNDGTWVPTEISGLFVVEEFHPYEPSAYVWHPCFTVVRPGACLNVEHNGRGCWDEELLPEDRCSNCQDYTVNEEDLIEQINPKLHGQILESEREMDFAEESW